jgi:general secretion pathway protein L
MAENLFIRLDESVAEATALVLNDEGRIVEPPRPSLLEDLAGLAAGRKVVVLLPGTTAIATRAAIPKASQSRVRQLLPYSLEEAFATDIDTLHFAAGRRGPSGDLAVSVISKERLEAWLEAIENSGIHPYAVYSEADGVPDTPSTLNLIIEGACIYGRRPGGAPFVLEGLSLPEILALFAAREEQGSDLQHLLVYIDSDSKPARLPELAEVHPRVASLDIKELPQGILPRLATTLVFEPGTNLLQGAYAPRSDVTGLLRPWYTAAALLLALIAVTVGTKAAEYILLKRQDAALTEQVAAICSRSFGSGDLSSCRTQMRSRLLAAGEQASSGSETFLSTLSVIADSQENESRIEALSYRNRVVDLQLTVPSVTSLDAFAQRISETDRFDVRVQSTTPRDSQVESRIQVVGAGP